MIFVYGENEKSLKVLELIKEKKSEKVLVVNMCGFTPFIFGDCDIIEFKNQDDMWDRFLDDKYFNEFITESKKHDLVVFYMNEEEDWLDNYANLERMIGKEIIVTAKGSAEIEVVDYGH